ncbi:MAG: hypothetical protein M3O46_13560 [Myxococcota bacterium]|nr:hypothetical protein [Myxococcota bacterium]
MPGVTVRPPILSNVGGVSLQNQYVVVPVMWGTWEDINGRVSVRNDVTATTVTNVQHLYDIIATSNYYEAIKSEYNLASLTSVPPVVFLPVSPPGRVSVDDIRNELNVQINNSILMHYYDGTAPGVNGRGVIFVVHLPASVPTTYHDLTYDQDKGFCAYHDNLTGLPFVVIPDNSTATLCGGGWDAISTFESHEIIETLTDPDGSNGWRDNRQPQPYNEIGDICANLNTVINTPLGTAHVQEMWSNQRGECDAVNGPLPPPPPPAPPIAPGCSASSTCSEEYFPAGYGPPTGYYKVETISVACQSPPSTVEQFVNGAWRSLVGFTPNASYGIINPNVFVIGTPVNQSGAAAGSVQTIRTCAASAAGTTCDLPVAVTIANCCVQLTCDGNCGNLSDECGGTLNCVPCDPCNSPEDCCVGSGGHWTNGECKKCKTPAQCCSWAGGDWTGHSCL